jgi:sugar phosphate isomerase/epimerase
MTTHPTHRIAGAPISWGVCEVPDWGYQLAPSRVLDEMRDVGLSATELGPEGFLPADPDQMAGVLAAHHLTAVGGFTPVVMHRGTDPADLTRQATDRIAHTHLKDVNSQVAAQVRAGRLSYTEAVAEGMYRPLGTGDVDVESIVHTLQGDGYAGWYTLEQDTILTEEPRGEGPVADVRISADYVSSLLTRASAGASTR